MAEVLTLSDLSAAEKRAVTGMKKSVMSLAESFGVVRAKASELAPPIMKLFKQLAAKHDDLDFVGFTRLFDASIPTHADDKDGVEGYRKHKVYYTLDYMRRLTMRRRTGQQGKTDPAVDQLARTIATILQIVKDPAPVWAALTDEFNFSARMLGRLKTRVAAAKPVIDLSHVVKPINIDGAKVIHMEPLKKAGTPATPSDVVMKAAEKAVGKRRQKAA